ncbi:MAG: molybdopterin synthase catalytic subunit MoaE [Gammaproteobacteria bacterium]|nr:MAG: molybdopterin synthase catalytic subunit MoaE [Gammaproteobacteria bacterium]
MTVSVKLLAGAFDPWQELAAHQSANPRLRGKFGATAVFVGTLRDSNQGNPVSAMTLEHYPAMTRKHLERITEYACRRWDVLDMLVIHRHGRLSPNDPIVLIAVWAAHRDAAFKACRYAIDELKTRAPFWKQEEGETGVRWVAPEEE